MKDSARKQLGEYLQQHPCMDCGETDIRVLEFDHLGEKMMEISQMVATGCYWYEILNEIGKCEVVCANCHRKRTYARSGSWRLAPFA